VISSPLGISVLSFTRPRRSRNRLWLGSPGQKMRVPFATVRSGPSNRAVTSVAGSAAGSAVGMSMGCEVPGDSQDRSHLSVERKAGDPDGLEAVPARLVRQAAPNHENDLRSE